MDDSYHGDLTEVECLRDLKKTDYFERVQTKLNTVPGGFNVGELRGRLKEFDKGQTGKIKIYHLINVFKYNYSNIFDHDTLTGL